MKALIIAVICAAPLMQARAEELPQKNFPAAKLTGLYVATSSGNISVGAALTDEVLVKVPGADPRKCAVAMRAEMGRLLLTAVPKAPGSGCPAGFSVLAPARLKLEAKTASGQVAVYDRSADVKIENGAGAVAFGGLTGALNVHNKQGEVSGASCLKKLNVTGNGTVKITGLCGPAAVTARNAELSWDVVPSTGSVSVTSKTGYATLTFPADAKLSAALKNKSGRIRNDFNKTRGYPVTVNIETGDISLMKAARAK